MRPTTTEHSRLGRWLGLGLKLFISALLLFPAGFLALVAWRGGDPSGLLLTGVLLAMTAILWIDWQRPTRAGAMIVQLFALGAALYATHRLLDAEAMPKACRGRGRSLCVLENLLYDIGGPVLAALPWFLVAGGLFALAVRISRRAAATRTNT